MKIIKYSSIAILLFIVFFTGCIPFLKMESGRTLSQGKSSIGLSATSYTISDNSNSSVFKRLTVPDLQVRAKHGITDRLELGVGFSNIGFFMFDGKYQVVGDKNSNFAMSLGIGGDALLFFLNRRESTDVSKNIKVSIPVYMSIHPSEKFYFFLNPQISRQIIFEKGDDSINFIGASMGIGFYNKIGEINIGGDYFRPLASLGGSIYQFGVAYKYSF